ncbi:5-bromo-4-chloroindolyl phosphate hydrolysis family protein [Roseovarius sp.]|jgi:hypothetical protein
MLFQKSAFPFSLPRNPRNLKSAQFLGFAALPLLSSTFFGVAMSVVTGLALLLLYGASIWTLTQGLRAEQAYDAAPVVRKPKVPLKLAAAGLMGLAVGATVFVRHGLTTEAVLVGLVAAGLFVAAFGIDPLKNKGVSGPLAEEALRANESVQDATAILKEIDSCVATIGDTDVSIGFKDLRRSAERLFTILRKDPERHRDLRRLLGVYLDAAREATERFAILHAAVPDADAKARYLAMLERLRDQFEDRTRKYLRDGHSKLDVELDVLQSRLTSEARLR